MHARSRQQTQTEKCLGVIVILGLHGAQEAPGLHGSRIALHLRLQRQHRLRQHAPPEQLPPLSEAVQVLRTDIAESVYSALWHGDGKLQPVISDTCTLNELYQKRTNQLCSSNVPYCVCRASSCLQNEGRASRKGLLGDMTYSPSPAGPATSAARSRATPLANSSAQSCGCPENCSAQCPPRSCAQLAPYSLKILKQWMALHLEQASL